jgi:DNA mismatch repair protein MutL
MQKWKGGKIDQQSFLFPLSIALSEERVEALMSAMHEIEKMGIEIERLGPSTVGIKSAPMFVSEKALTASIEKLSEEIIERGSTLAFEKCLVDIFATMACHSVVRAGQALSAEEMKSLLNEMDEFSFSSFCPHGRPVSVSWGRAEIERLFGRRPN